MTLDIVGAQGEALADGEPRHAAIYIARHIGPDRLQRFLGKAEPGEEFFDGFGILPHLRLRLGKIGRAVGVGDRPSRQVGGDIAFGEPADGNRSLGLLCTQQAIAEQVASDDETDRDD
jgi:hypothetical protein